MKNVNTRSPISYVKQSGQQNIGMILVIFAGVFWGLISIFINQLTTFDYDSLQIMCLRSWVSVFLLLIFFLIYDKRLLIIDPRDIWMFLGSGILSLAFFSYCYFTTIINCGAAIAVVLLYTSPIFVMLMSSIVFHEKITLRKLSALALTFIGCILVAGLIGNGQSISPMAFIVGLGAGFGYALYSIFAGLAVRKYSSLTVTFYTLLTCGVSSLFFCHPGHIIATFELSSMPYIIGISLICTVIPYICYTFGLKRMEVGKAAVLVTIEPLVGCILGLAVFHEEASTTKILGIILILSAVIILAKNQRMHYDNASLSSSSKSYSR